MGDLTKNFSRSEFACKCGCGFNTIDFELLTALQHCCDRLKTALNKEITVGVNCGCRCKTHNDNLRKKFKDSKGKEGEDTAENSQHIYGRAVDAQFFANGEKIKPADIYDFFQSNYKHFGLGSYLSFTHIDTRSTGQARW
jgi:uncharacterized protein YcbK (DUF882 family)